MSMSNTAREIEVAGRPLRCQLCEHTRFHERSVRLSASATPFFGLDWNTAKATCRICARCGYVHWFLPAVDAVLEMEEPTDLAQELEALRRSLDDLYDQPTSDDLDEVLSGG